MLGGIAGFEKPCIERYNRHPPGGVVNFRKVESSFAQTEKRRRKSGVEKRKHPHENRAGVWHLSWILTVFAATESTMQLSSYQPVSFRHQPVSSRRRLVSFRRSS